MAESETAQPKRWSAKRKMEVVLRLLRGEPVDDISREDGVEIYHLEEWRRETLTNLEDGFKSRIGNSLEGELTRAKQKICEPSIEVELLHGQVYRNIEELRQSIERFIEVWCFTPHITKSRLRDLLQMRFAQKSVMHLNLLNSRGMC